MSEEWHPPTEEDKWAVSVLAQRAIAGIRQVCAAQRRKAGEHLRLAPKPMPDVTLKGDALRKSREARGCHVPPERKSTT
jgi:hypothetical protein